MDGVDEAVRHFKLLILVIVGLSLQVATARGQAAAARIALVIGNSAYAEAPLANPANDARLMAETLRGLGFDVIERIDANRKTIQLATFELQDRLLEAGKDAVGLFYYAGHGVQVGGQNYLIPLNSEIEKEREVAIEAVSTGFVLKQMEFADNRMNFIILDACRNNPLMRSFRSATRGLARMDAPRGSLVAYSTGPGEVAADGTGSNSPYTLALSQAMRTPGVPAEKMFKLVRDSVMAVTKGEQTPWEESSLTGTDFFFAPDEAVAAQPEPKAAPAAALDPAEQAFWQAIADSDSASDYRSYLQDYPDGIYASLAKSRADALQSGSDNQATRGATASELAFWEAIKDSDNAADYEAYLQQFPEGDFAALARVRLAAADEARRLEDERVEAERAVAEQKAAADATSNPDVATASTGGAFDGKWALNLEIDTCAYIGISSGTIVSLNSKVTGSIALGSLGILKATGSIRPSGELEGFTLKGRFLLRLKGSISGDKGKGRLSVIGLPCDGSFSLARIEAN